MVVAAILAVIVAALCLLPAHNGGPLKENPPARLTATVSASGQVSLSRANGKAVTRLRSGWYTLSVSTSSPGADFKLIGPGVRHRTRMHFTGITVWGVHFVKGTYRYMSDQDLPVTTQVITVY